MRVEALNVGWFTTPTGIWRQGESMEERTRFPVPAYLVETETERILVDTGLHPEAPSGGRYPDSPQLGLFELEQERSVAEQVELSTLTRVVLTHLHFDHAGGLALLPPGVPVVLQRREWEAAHDDEAIVRNFLLPVDYAGLDQQLVLVDGPTDLLGDGSVVLLPTPGHTPGHQSVRVGENLVIGGDVTHFATGLDDLRLPVFADNHESQVASAERLRELRDAGARVTPGHDPAALRPGALLGAAG